MAGRRHALLVVGGGVYGAAVAWDAAQRGLDVALVESRDFGGGTSWNSLKTIHGGLRHLQRGELGLLRESVRERRALLRIAPGLVRPLGFLVPTYGHGRRGREILAAGVLLNELLAAGRNRGLAPDRQLPGCRILDREQVLERAPGVSTRGLSGGVLWYDAQVASSERLVLAFLEAASAAGALLANHAEVTALLRDGPKVTGAVVRDHASGGSCEVRAEVVVNAAGPDAERIWRFAGLRPTPDPLCLAVNLVLRRRLVSDLALGALRRGRYLFLVPWRDRSIAGTAYGPADEAPAALAASLMHELQAAYPWAAPTWEDVAVLHQGRVPGDPDRLRSGSRVVDHAREGAPGLITLFGAKYTTARAGAESAVDLAVRRLGRPAPPCRTHVTPLPGASIPRGPLSELARRAVRDEMALDLEDVVLRRLEAGSAGPLTPEELDAVGSAVAAERGWDGDQLDRARTRLAGAWGPGWHPRSERAPDIE